MSTHPVKPLLFHLDLLKNYSITSNLHVQFIVKLGSIFCNVYVCRNCHLKDICLANQVATFGKHSLYMQGSVEVPSLVLCCEQPFF